MHPDRRFHAAPPEPALTALIAAEGWGQVVAPVAGRLHVQHTPLVMGADGTIRFHLANAGPLVPDLAGGRALIIVNGPHAYVSPHWYGPAIAREVPTWNYLAAEAEGPVAALDRAALIDLLDAIAAQEEARLAPKPAWTAAETDPGFHARLLDAITGFALRPERVAVTAKLSQNKPVAVRAGVARALAAAGHGDLAAAMTRASDMRGEAGA